MRKYAAIALTLTLLLPSLSNAAVTYGRDKLKGTTKTQGDFNLANRFSLKIGGVLASGVTQIGGLQKAVDQIYLRQKNLHLSITKNFSRADLAWWQSGARGSAARKNISIQFHTAAGAPTGRINFYNCRPTKWKGPALNARTSAHATETIDLLCENGKAGA